MYGDQPISRERAGALIAVATIHIALGYALLSGFAVDFPTAIARSIETFAVLPPVRPAPKPIPKPRRPTHRAPRKEGAASPANLTARATEIVAPPVVIPPPVPPPVIAAVVASTGAADHSGNAPVPGPGTGSGGVGVGTGNGRYGDGPGGGGSGTPSEWISGRLKDSDYPRQLYEAGIGGTVSLRFVVGVAGRVTDCAVTRSSGNRLLDTLTCDLIVKRLRYRPARDAAGHPIPDVIIGEHRWYTYDAPRDEADED